MSKINPRLREEIQIKINKLSERPEFYEQRRKLVTEDLKSIGDVYSFWIENPELRKSLLLENKQLSTIKKKAREGIQAVNNAWYFLINRGKHGDFIQIFDEEILKRVNELVEPVKIAKTHPKKVSYLTEPVKIDKPHEQRDFRKDDVSLNILGYTPPSWERVPERVRESILRVKEEYGKDPLQAAILAHLEIAAIQPFIEGNKRTARLIQDRILHDAQMPPSIIPAGEGTFYMDLVSRTCRAYKAGDSENQRQFYDYCASKVNNGLDEILNDLCADHR